MRERLLHPTEYVEPKFVRQNPTLKKLKLWLIFTVVVYFLFSAGVTWHLTFGVKRPPTSSPNRHGAKASDVEFTTEDHMKLKAWFSREENKPVVILAHGRGGSRDQMTALYRMVTFKVGAGWLLFDFRACGGSDGYISTGGIEESKDLRAAIKYLETQGYRRSDMGLVAYDMGGLAAINMADEINSLAAVVLIGAGNSLKKQLANRLHGWKLPLHPTATLGLLVSQIVTGKNLGLPFVDTKLARLTRVPVMLVGGDQDHVIPPERIKAMARLIPSQNTEIKMCVGMGHDDLVRASNSNAFRVIAKWLRGRLIRD